MVLDRQTDQGFIVLTNRVNTSDKNQEFLAASDQLFAIYLTEKEKTLWNLYAINWITAFTEYAL